MVLGHVFAQRPVYLQHWMRNKRHCDGCTRSSSTYSQRHVSTPVNALLQYQDLDRIHSGWSHCMTSQSRIDVTWHRRRDIPMLWLIPTTAVSSRSVVFRFPFIRISLVRMR
ncbi:hypothetical protein CONLIGDRAFT_286600 [Coniochaeta ligniaria NRRL 30616]|uniref:Uncharacterized protein n=1 Tax=Coniochaeta ligniaria NRRL 30616 TaxID=1408157 RepID=A0A1J7JMW4_9PEZI|nr:hypothetical protein CONLIGDRAFT_286600 [Coniochaeta ligniaria NRRL 30616]